MNRRNTVMILSFWTDRPGQTVYTQIRLLPRSSLVRVCIVCHSICLFWAHYSMVEPHCSNFRIITAIVWVSEYLGILRYPKLFWIHKKQRSEFLIIYFAFLCQSEVWNLNYCSCISVTLPAYRDNRLAALFFIIFLIIGKYYMSPVTRQPVLGVCDQVRLKPAWSATETS